MPINKISRKCHNHQFGFINQEYYIHLNLINCDWIFWNCQYFIFSWPWFSVFFIYLIKFHNLLIWDIKIDTFFNFLSKSSFMRKYRSSLKSPDLFFFPLFLCTSIFFILLLPFGLSYMNQVYIIGVLSYINSLNPIKQRVNFSLTLAI